MKLEEIRKKGLERLFELARSVLSAPERWCYTHDLLDREGLPFPDFLGIGAQKSGTTWLWENLDRHPDVYMARPKEVHYFDWNYYQSPRAYSRHFKRYPRGRIQGEITPEYGIIPKKRIQFVRGMNPNLKVLFLMRNPVDRAWSQAYMNLVRNTGRNFEEVPESEFIDHFRSDRSIDRGRYQSIIDRWADVFGREAIFADLYDRIASDPKNLLIDIFNHLEIETEVDWEEFPYKKRIHAASGKPSIPEHFKEILTDIHKPDIEYVADEFGGAAENWMDDLYPSRYRKP